MHSSLTVHIGEDVLKNVIAHAEADIPHETCGLLLGQRNADQAIIHSSQPTQNISAKPTTRFEIDPQAVLRVTQVHAHGNSQLIGFYHAHPDGSIEPSTHDQKSAWAQMLYLIVGVTRNRPTQASAWHTERPGAPFIRDELSTIPTELTVI